MLSDASQQLCKHALITLLCCPNPAAHVYITSTLEDQESEHVPESSKPCQAPELAARIRGALPGAPLLGGVLRGEAWGGRSLRGKLPVTTVDCILCDIKATQKHWYERGGRRAGALFLGDRTLDSGAVGCLLAGPIQASWVTTGPHSPCMAATVACCRHLVLKRGESACDQHIWRPACWLYMCRACIRMQARNPLCNHVPSAMPSAAISIRLAQLHYLHTTDLCAC